jgi:hypothetical protein
VSHGAQQRDVVLLLLAIPPNKEHTMSRRKQKSELTIVELEVPAVELPTLADIEIDAEVADDIAKPNSVVKRAYKEKYAERNKADGKRAQRSCWDWLAQELAAECLDDKAKISIERFLALLEANGVDHSRWQNRSKGWEGRLRMTGRLALQKVVAAQGGLKTAEGAMLEAPAEWVAKFTN